MVWDDEIKLLPGAKPIAARKRTGRGETCELRHFFSVGIALVSGGKPLIKANETYDRINLAVADPWILDATYRCRLPQPGFDNKQALIEHCPGAMVEPK